MLPLVGELTVSVWFGPNSKAPESQLVPGPARPTPRLAVVWQLATPRSIATLPGIRPCVCVGPPRKASGVRPGPPTLSIESLDWLPNVQPVVEPITFPPVDAIVPRQ